MTKMKTTKTILLLITLSVILISPIIAQDLTLDWVVQMGGLGLDNGRSIAFDNAGNVITTGRIDGNITCSLYGGEKFDLTTVGTSDIFIQKLGPEGNHIWTRHCGGTGTAQGQEVITDASGNIIVMGNFAGTVDFDPGPGTFNLTYIASPWIGWATFILKLDANGNFLWAKQTEPVFGGSFGYSMVMDASGNLITTGYYGGRVDFDPGPGTASHLAGGNLQVFILKLDGSGNFLWVNELGSGNADDYGYSVVTDASGNIYTTGSFQGTVDFDPSKKGTFNMTAHGYSDIFIQKSGPGGNFLWAKQMGGTLSEAGESMTMDAFGNLYISGYFSGTVDFDPGAGTFNLTSNSISSPAFIQKLNAAGNFVWAVQLEGTGTIHNWSGIWSIHADALGNVYTAGYFGGTADFDPGAGVYEKTCNDTVDGFILKVDAGGNFNWALQVGGVNGYNCGLAINTDLYGNVYSSGFFGGDASGFDPGNPAFQLHSNGSHDYFLVKLTQGTSGCIAPIGLNVTNISYYSALLNWISVTGAVNYDVRYRVNNTVTWNLITGISSTNFLVSGLTPATLYEFQVQTNCGESQSGFSSSSTFTTLGPECTDIYEPNESLGTAKAISVNTDVNALIAIAGDLDWFKFNNANNKKRIKITLTDLPANYDVALYNAGGALVAISQNTGTASESIIYNTSTVGTYYINVYGYNGASDLFHCYTLNASVSNSNWKSIGADEDDPDAIMDCAVYPNPASTLVNIDINSVSDDKITVRLTDVSGKTISTDEFQAAEGMNHFTIDLNDFRDGVYFMVLTSNDQNYFRKIIIRK
jgi:hypothetical protein